MQTVNINAGTTFTTAANQWGLIGDPANVVKVVQPGQCVTASFARTITVGTQAEILAAYKAATGKDWVAPAPPPPPPPPALPSNWQAQVAAMGKLAQPLLPAGGLADLAAALAACQTVPGQFWVVQKLVFGLGITQAQIDATVTA